MGKNSACVDCLSSSFEINESNNKMDWFPQLFTHRLTLRKITIDDVPSLLKYANNRKIADSIWNIPFPYHEPDAVFRIRYVHEGFAEKSRYIFAIILNVREEMIGEISLHVDRLSNLAQLGYWVGEPFWGKGIATEAAGAVLEFGFRKLQLEVIYAECRAANQASQAVLVNNGMVRNITHGNVVQYRFSKEEFEAQKNLLSD
jgi:[ribosomal protein S5]-alanine N-acetyltransferase